MSEAKAKRVFYQIGSAVAYCHALNIAHRDIKPENIFYSEIVGADGLVNIKASLLDFGLSKSVTDSQPLATLAGTVNYTAPEVMFGSVYDLSCDLYSIGASISFCLMGNNIHKNPKNEMDRTTRRLQRDHIWAGLSEEVKDLLGGLINPDIEPRTPQIFRTNSLLDGVASTRMTVEQMLQHPWFHEIAAEIQIAPANVFNF